MGASESAGFVPPNEERRTKALGDLSNECTATKKALSNIKQYWQPIRAPVQGDWLWQYNHGCYGYDQFQGKKITQTKNTIYIQPIVYASGSVITPKLLEKLKKWLEAFYMPCKIKILPQIVESTLKQNTNIANK